MNPQAKLVKHRFAHSTDIRTHSPDASKPEQAEEEHPPEFARATSLPTSITRSKNQLFPAALKFKPGKRFKAFKRESTYIVNNVPILGAGAPRPTVLHTLPDQRTKSVLHSLLVLGATNAGKSSLLERYVQRVFYNENQPTVGRMYHHSLTMRKFP